MPDFHSESICRVALHHVGNKQTEEGFILSDQLLPLNEQLQDLLLNYFITPFKGDEYYQFYHDDHLELHSLYRPLCDLFDAAQQEGSDSATFADTFRDLSRQFAQALYDACLHPNIKSGDLFVVYFNQCQIEGETVDAVGLFKSENKDSFLKVLRDEEEWSRQEGDRSATAHFAVDIDRGINIHKLDKGALIFNREREQGYIVSVVDATNRTAEALYWKDNFLQIRQRQDEYYNTHQVMSALKQFVTDELPQQFEVTKADQADLLNKSVNFFKQNDSFDMEDFARDVIQQPEVMESFAQFKESYEQENDIQLPQQFAISDEAVKKQARSYKSVIKLDKNFHIYVHGDRQLIEQGEDEKGKYYKVYYHEES